MHTHWTLRSALEHACVNVMYKISFNGSLQAILLETLKFLHYTEKATPLNAHSLSLPFP